jgi:hypothetical protein
VYAVKFKLPPGFKCDKCILQWHVSMDESRRPYWGLISPWGCSANIKQSLTGGMECTKSVFCWTDVHPHPHVLGSLPNMP